MIDGSAEDRDGMFVNGSTEAVYIGAWADDMRNGQGVFSWHGGSDADGSVYDGEWKDHDREGPSTMTYASDGSYYVGEWSNSKKDGQGTAFNADGTVRQQGQWVADEYVG
jgi:hypothetical protein